MIYGYDLRLRRTTITRGIIDKACNDSKLFRNILDLRKRDLNVTCIHSCKSDSAETKRNKEERRNHDHICRFYCCQIESSDRRKYRKEAMHTLSARVITQRRRQCLVSVSGRIICKDRLLANGASIPE